MMKKENLQYVVVGWLGFALVGVFFYWFVWGRGIRKEEAVAIATQHLLREAPELAKTVEVSGEFHDNQGNWSVFFRDKPPALRSYVVVVSKDGKVQEFETSEPRFEPPKPDEDEDDAGP